MTTNDLLKLGVGLMAMIAGIIFMIMGYSNDIEGLRTAGWSLIMFTLGQVFNATPTLVKMLGKRKKCD